MSDRESNQRAKVLGLLIQDARAYTGRSVEECAEVIEFTPEQFTRLEQGEQVISLPELEALAIFLKIPMGYFWGTDRLEKEESPDFGRMIALRHRVIGVLLRQLRLKSQKNIMNWLRHWM